MASGKAHGAGNVLENFKDNLDLVIKQIKDGETERESDDTFEAKQYWMKIGSVFKSLSHEATKLSLAFSSPPLPDEKTCKSLVDTCEKATLGLVSLFYSLPKYQGLYLRKSLKSAVLGVLQDLQTLVHVLHDSGAGSTEQLQSTGIVWQDTDRFSSLPKDNKEAVLGLMKVTSELVRDALGEMQDAVENGPANDLAEVFGLEMDEPSNEDTWSETDKTLLGPCLGLLKTSRSLLKKSRESVSKRASCHCTDQISQLDDLADYIGRLSPVVDEFASSLYPPMKYSSVQENAKDLYNLQRTILSFYQKCHMCNEDDQKWVEFLLKANQHNWENIKQCTDTGHEKVT
ncbi:cyclin-D1-binding protein 1 homolog [Ylistrum balloti]|uniref:cyclin-D1-binding protein 1 homolog n=1 Tax=Ylistrum balloti TaxID=509963 RepID=UPI002905ADDE|nr:cyclin-D1-binding protein 1 homolog [Ylistrum balloti]